MLPLFLLLAAPLPVEKYDPNVRLTPADYRGRTLRELTLMRNITYAKANNAFRRRWLNVWFSAQPWYSPDGGLDESKITDTMRANADELGDYEARLTREELLKLRDAARARAKAAGGKPSTEDDIELRLLSLRLGAWAGEGPPPKDLNALEDPKRLDKLLALSDLDDYSPRDLRLLRNTIFARRGRPFKTPLLQGHFATVDWYKPDPAYQDSRLTAVDKKNIQLVLGLEKKLRPPKDEEPPDAFFMAA